MIKFCTTAFIQILIILLWNVTYGAERLYVNEILASNSSGIRDIEGNPEDWFEIYNPNNYEINLAGYYLSDNASNPTKFRITTGSDAPKIPANGFIIIWASSHPERGVTHTSFGLSASGEDLVISSPANELIDKVTFGNQTADISYGRKPDGSGTLVFFSTVTPGSSNNNAATVLPKLSNPVFSHTAGFKTAGFNLALTHSEANVRIRYTTDGSDPQDNTTVRDFKYKNKYNDDGTHTNVGGVGEGWSIENYSAKLYSEPIAIADRTSAPNKVSRKTSSITYNPDYLPTSLIYKGTVIRAKAFKDGFTPSETITKTYFINTNGGTKYAVPVVAITSQETSFFDYDNGIYTPGVTFDKFRRDNPTEKADFCSIGNFTNSGDLWERPGSIEFFDNNNLILSQNFAFRIHGGCSRAVPQKTLRLYSDTEFNFAVFPEKPTRFPKRLLLRNSGNDNNSTLFRDSYFQKLVGNLPFDTQLSRPAVVFINSEYWGIQNITERYDKYYLEKKYNVNRDNVDMIDVELPEVEEGDIDKYNELMNFANNNSLAVTANYNMIQTMIDLENFTDYQIAQIYSGNIDWPHKNIRLWRNKVTYDPNANVPYGHDGRWRWMLYDIDFGLGLYSSVTDNTITGATTKGAPSVILRKLLENTTYKTYFVNRIADLLNTTFLTSRSIPLLNETKALYTPLIQDHITRWNSPPSVPSWDQRVTDIGSYLSNRAPNFRGHVRQSFSNQLTDMTLTVDVNDATKGYVKVNTINIIPSTDGISTAPYPWTGSYFQNNLMKLTAIATQGNHFVRWERAGSTVGTTEELPITATTNTLSYKAIFEAGALPVVLKSFTAKKEDSKIVLNWETTSEINNDYFVVERSADALLWSSLATIKGSATTENAQQYKTTDEQPMSNINYYRLKQVDFDKTNSYSRIVSVDMGNFSISNLWPNPVNEVLNITLDKDFQQADFEITDINGTSVRKLQKVPANNAVKIPVGNLPVGTYFMKITTEDGLQRSGKFVKQ